MAVTAAARSRGRLIRQKLPQPGPVYDQAYLAKLADAVNAYMLQATAPSDVVAARFVCTDPLNVPNDIPDTSTLPTGMYYLTQAPPPPATGLSAANPAGTSSTTWVMMGLSLQFTATSNWTQGAFTIDGNIGNTGNGNTYLNLAYGTGTPPVNGAPLTGTLIGATTVVTGTGGGAVSPFSRTVLLSGLTPGVTYWIGTAVQVSSGTSILSNVELTGRGLQTATLNYVTIVTPQDPAA